MHQPALSALPAQVQALLDQIDPIAYARSRNYTDGAVTRLSPFVSRGVLSGPQILSWLLRKGYSLPELEKLVQQLAWREYFQRVWQVLGDDMFDDIRSRHTGIRTRQIPKALVEGCTGIEAVDSAIRQLEETGYMHNHLRLYTASLACNFGKAWWPASAQWMYYHLLDGDPASNTCSWQWVAGNFSQKPYFCNQENINRFSGTAQTDTFLDLPYSSFPLRDVPEVLAETISPEWTTPLPERSKPDLDPAYPLHLYSPFNLDPQWRAGEKANRVLLLEPSHYRSFPVSGRVIDFILEQARTIEGIQVFAGEWRELPGLNEFPQIRSKEHPAFGHWPGTKDQRDWLFPDLQGWYPSFFRFWKEAWASLQRQPLPAAALQRA